MPYRGCNQLESLCCPRADFVSAVVLCIAIQNIGNLLVFAFGFKRFNAKTEGVFMGKTKRTSCSRSRSREGTQGVSPPFKK